MEIITIGMKGCLREALYDYHNSVVFSKKKKKYLKKIILSKLTYDVIAIK